MKVQNQGVLPASNVYFHTRSETARRLFFYPLCTGQYWCDGSYQVQRVSYRSFLLLFVVKGSGYVMCGGRETPLCAGNIFLLDCYIPHCYGTHTGWEILWVHFDGTMAREYFTSIAQGKECSVLIPSDPQNAQRNFEKLYAMYHEKNYASEPLINKYITNILTDFLTSGSAASMRAGAVTEELLAYITENLQKPLSLEHLARRASLSPYYFTRQFKKETGRTPHEYLILARVNAAKYYLKTTSLPIKEISYKCGFSSEAGFCTTFKRLQGVTPAVYRSAPL